MTRATGKLPRQHLSSGGAGPVSPISCASCVAHLADVEFSLLPESDQLVVSEHLSGCPDCRLFQEQIETTTELLGTEPVEDITSSVERARSELAERGVERSVQALYRLARALGVDDADELVQDTLTRAIGAGASLDSPDLITALIRASVIGGGEPTASLNVAPDGAIAADDPDGETAELFYPDFYDDGPDLGRFVDAPNIWGSVRTLAPHDEVSSTELYEIAESAISELPDLERRLITVVDIESLSFDDAIAALSVSDRRAARALNRARIHVRGAIDSYLSSQAASSAGSTVSQTSAAAGVSP